MTANHVGDPDELIGFTAAVLDWAADHALEWDVSETASGRRWGCRLLVDKTDSARENDADIRETELLFRLAD